MDPDQGLGVLNQANLRNGCTFDAFGHVLSRRCRLAFVHSLLGPDKHQVRVHYYACEADIQHRLGQRTSKETSN